MFLQKKKEKMSYKSYWERMLGYNFDSEFAIYNFLCDQKIKKKDLKKVPIDKRFNTYYAWENHVKSQYCNAQLNELQEFYKYLNHKKRGNDNHNILNGNILMPMMITIISVLVMPVVFDITNNYDKINNLGLSNIFVKKVLLVSISLAQLYFVTGCILWLVIFTSKAFVNSKQVEVYHEDYMKIINEIIVKKRAQALNLLHGIIY